MQKGGGNFGDLVVGKRSCKQMSMEGFVPKKVSRQANSDDVQMEIQALLEQLRQKDAQIQMVQKKLNHFRSWMNNLQSKVNMQNSQAVKNARRLYIGGFPQGSSEEDLQQFISKIMKVAGGCVQVGSPVLSIKMMKDKNYAFAEFRSVEEAANATAFDGVAYKDSYLKVKRPSNYDVNSAVLLGPVSPDPTMDTSSLDICRNTVEDSPNKLFIGGLPYDNSEEQVRDILASFGSLKSFNLVMDRNTGKSKGYAFCELLDGSLTDHVIQQLNCRKIGNKSLTVKRAAEGIKSSSPLLSSMLGSGTSTLQNHPTQMKGMPKYGMAAMSSFGFGNASMQTQHPHSLGPSGMQPASKGMLCNVPPMHGGMGQGMPQIGMHHQGMKDVISQPMMSCPPVGLGSDRTVSSSPEQVLGDAGSGGPRMPSMIGPNSPTMHGKPNGLHQAQGPPSVNEFGMFGNFPPFENVGLQGLGSNAASSGMHIGGGMSGMMGGRKMDEAGFRTAYGGFPPDFSQGFHNHHGGLSMGGGVEQDLGMTHLSAMW